MSDTINGTITQTISFDTIPYTILTPQTIIEVAANYSQAGLLPFPATILAMGQMASGAGAGTALANTSYNITRKGQAEVLFGTVSPITDAINLILANNNGAQPIHAIAAAAAAGSAAATSTVTFAATATNGGTLPFLVADRSAPTIVNVGDTVTVQAASFASVVNADPLMPVTAVAALGVVTLTSKYPGVAGNTMRVRFANSSVDANGFIAGCSVTIVDPVNGTGGPDIAPMIGSVSNDWRTDIALGITDATTLVEMEAELERRYAANGRLDAHVYYVQAVTVGTALSTAAANNSRFMSRVPYIGNSQPWKVSAALCGVGAFQLTNDPARQLKTLPLVGILPPDPVTVPIMGLETEELLGAGWSTCEVLTDGTVTLQRVVTCNVSTNGIPDSAWRDIMRPKTMTRIRYDWANYFGLVWPRAKLSDDDSVAAQFDPNVLTPRRAWNSWAARCQLYAQAGWIENVPATLKKSVFQRVAGDPNRLNARQVVDQIGNEMVLAARLEFLAS